MALNNKIILGKEHYDTTKETPISSNIKSIKTIKPKFAPGMRFPCQE
jgi:hypothetical protein